MSREMNWASSGPLRFRTCSNGRVTGPGQWAGRLVERDGPSKGVAPQAPSGGSTTRGPASPTLVTFEVGLAAETGGAPPARRAGIIADLALKPVRVWVFRFV